jgi:hypothetical protein
LFVCVSFNLIAGHKDLINWQIAYLDGFGLASGQSEIIFLKFQRQVVISFLPPDPNIAGKSLGGEGHLSARNSVSKVGYIARSTDHRNEKVVMIARNILSSFEPKLNVDLIFSAVKLRLAESSYKDSFKRRNCTLDSIVFSTFLAAIEIDVDFDLAVVSDILIIDNIDSMISSGLILEHLHKQHLVILPNFIMRCFVITVVIDA